MEKATKTKSVFDILSAIDCSEHVEKKRQGSTELTYLSWAWAWSICKKNFPAAFYTIYERADGVPYFTDGKTCWVKTGVTIEGQEYIEYLPIMDFRNQSIALDKVTSMDMNKAIQRSLTKALARHGLGLYIYAGEDLPEEKKEEQKAAVDSDLEQMRLEVLDNIPNIQTLEESGNYWNWIKANFKEGTPQFSELKDALAKKNRELKAKAAKKAQPQQQTLDTFNFDQIK